MNFYDNYGIIKIKLLKNSKLKSLDERFVVWQYYENPMHHKCAGFSDQVYDVIINKAKVNGQKYTTIANQEVKTIAKVSANYVLGNPIELHSDQGRNFESSIFQEGCQIFGINKTGRTLLHSQSGGMVERFNRTLEEHLRKVIDDDQQDWDEHIPIFLMAYRSAVNNTTALPPAKILFGSNLRLPADMKFGTPPDRRDR
uniref:Integrase catalytic domain-containing protein n=1 Tax=Glossina morsitans morsitans TaxID=37546 RepID=A0A1B0GEE5_GLOMM